MVSFFVLFHVMQSLCIVSNTFLLDDGTSCTGRCGTYVDTSKPCQCNSHCLRYNDCCVDYDAVCNGVSTNSNAGNCMTMSQISQELWDNDVNRLSSSDIKVNYQTQIPDYSNTDRASQKLFTYVNEAKLSSKTYTSFLHLLNNYQPAKGSQEHKTSGESHEEMAFLDAVMGTKVMDSLLKYLTCRGIIKSQAELKSTLSKIWFDFYPRSGASSVPDTSGFEHVMVGEYKTIDTVNGFHNWLSFYEKEKTGQLNYYGFVTRQDPNLIGAAFKWNNHMKYLGGFFIGTSPEFEMAIYSLCFLTNAGSSCPLVINGHPVSIRSYDKDGHIATVFVDIM